jgi:hypothetical protein
LGDFFAEVFVHCMALGLFLGVGGGLALHFKNKFCDDKSSVSNETALYFMLMTILLSSLTIIVLHFGGPYTSSEE